MKQYLKNYLQKKSKLGIAIDVAIIILMIFIAIPATRKNTVALLMKPTLWIHQPKINSTKTTLNNKTYEWELKDMNGNTLSLNTFKGNVILINLWATWCPPCIAELPDLQKLYKSYGDKVTFLFVSNEDSQKIKTFLNKENFVIPTYIPVTNYPHDFETNSIPTTFIINKKGEVIINQKGVAQWNSRKIRGVLDALLAE